MAMSRDYHDAPYIIPGLRIRKIRPSTRRHPRRDIDQVAGPVLGAPPERDLKRDLSKRLKGVQIDRPFAGVVRQNGPLAGVLRQNAPHPDDQVAAEATTPKTATPPEGAEMPLKGVEDPGGTDARESPLRQNLKGDRRGFWRSGDADPCSGAR